MRETWEMLQSHLAEFENQQASLEQRAGALYQAIEDVRNLALFIRRADDHEHQEKLESIAVQMGVEANAEAPGGRYS
jgi:prefoldin subunit 5